MMTSVIGKKFLKLYNSKCNTNYSAEDFFLNVFYPMFFGKNKYMMTAGNSPLENPKISWKDIILGKNNKAYDTLEEKEERLKKLLEKINTGVPDASTAVGYPVKDIFGKTSGQVSNIDYITSSEDIYMSWVGAALGIGIKNKRFLVNDVDFRVGAALGIGIKGGVSILFEEEQILWDIFEGWGFYRKMLEETNLLKGNQIDTWNGQWLSHKYSDDFDEEYPMDNFFPMNTQKEIFEINTQNWTQIIYGISRLKLPNRLVGYVYSVGQTNTTLGFLPFDLAEIRRPFDLYLKFFGEEDFQVVKSLYGNDKSFMNLCQLGIIGVKALRPKGLKQYFENGEIPKYSDNKDKIIINNTYLIWLMAMLNNQDLWDKSQLFAKTLCEFASQNKKAKTDKSNSVNELLKSKNKITFIDSLTKIVQETENTEIMTEMAMLINLMPNDNVPYFLTLLRFQYAIQNK